MRASLLLSIVFCLTPLTSRADFTIDLVWADTGTGVLPASVALDSTQPVNPICRGIRYDGPATGHCLTVRLRAEAPFKAVLATLGWNNAASGMVAAFTPEKSHGQFGRNPGLVGFGARAIVPATPAACTVPGCDTAYGSFGGEVGGAFPAGAYLLGSFVLDLSGATPGTHEIHSFVRDGLDGAFDSTGNSRPVERNQATVLAPEPTTLVLLATGLFALLGAKPRR